MEDLAEKGEGLCGTPSPQLSQQIHVVEGTSAFEGYHEVVSYTTNKHFMKIPNPFCW